MAHLQKFTQAEYPKLLMHYERKKDENGDYHKFRNQDIDLSRTYQNYNVADFQTLPQFEFMDKRLSQLKIFKRDDVKYMCDWIITLPKGMEPEEREFFDAVLKFLIGKYKKENVISAYVHKDENQPHMHFAFVPVAMDKKKNIEKLCSKEIVSRDDMFAFHEELDNYLTDVFGYITGVRNGATVEGNKSIDELKRGTAVKELGEKKAELKAVEERIDKLKWPSTIKPVKEKSDTVVISKDDLQSANDTLAKKDLLESKAEDADKILKTDYRKENFKLQNEIRKLKSEQSALVTAKNNLSNQLTRIQRVFDRNPKFWESFLQLASQMERAAEAEIRSAEAIKRAQKQAEKGEAELG